MGWRAKGAGEALRSPIPWVVLSAALALTAAGWVALERNRDEEARMQFERGTQTAEAAVRARVLSYEQILRSGAAHVASSPGAMRAGWGGYIAQLRLGDRFPGIEKMDFDERPAEAEPDPERRAAMERAGVTADVAISGKVIVAGEPGFVMYVPVLARPANAPRAAALKGFVYSPLRMHELLHGILDEGLLRVLDMQVFDSATERPATVLIDTRAGRAPVAYARPAFQRQLQFQMPGRLWTIQFLSRPEFDAALEAARPWSLLAAALVASVMMFMLTVALVAAWNRAHELSMRDPLTGLYNRRYLEETMGREIPRARRRGESVGVIVLDIDHFKLLNDTYGHDAGDHVLERTGEVLRAATRNSDIACRFGGEEFAVVLPGASLLVARNRAEAIRASLESLRVDFGGQAIGPLTVSAGVAAMPPHAQDWAFVMQQADRALYTAKQAGRNKVVAAVDD